MSKFWGQHLIVDASGADFNMITDRENHALFLKQLVKDIDMVAYGEPLIEHFATHDPDKAGYSIVQLIETSNITAHFVDKDGSVYLDVFSCKPFNINLVIDCMIQYYGIQDWSIRNLGRSANRLLPRNISIGKE